MEGAVNPLAGFALSRCASQPKALIGAKGRKRAMKYAGPLTHEERVERRREWHRWFAWHPVRVGRRDFRWLETIERRGEYKWFGHASWGWDFEYRANS